MSFLRGVLRHLGIAERGGRYSTAREVRLVCLAFSRKHGGRCLAGIDMDSSSWIRPVSDAPNGTLYPAHYLLDDVSEPQLLDVLTITLDRASREPHQPENWLLTPHVWRRAERPPPEVLWEMILHMVADGPLLGGPGDRISYDSLRDTPAQASLALIKPADVWFIVTKGHAGRPQVRSRFALGAWMYNLAVTDIDIEARLAHSPEGNYRPRDLGLNAGRLLFTVSLGEPFEGQCYKLVAAVFERPAAA